jgi:hypothetical protein
VSVHSDHTGPPTSVLDPATGPDERTAGFLELSARLTGFGRVELNGTGLVDTYLGAVAAVLPDGLLDEFLDAFGRLPAGGDADDAVASTILADARFGPVARNIIMLWYCGTWRTLPPEWRARYGASPLDVDHVVTAEAYQGGLQWLAAKAHPAGARQQGYGAWSVAPEGSRG